MSCHWFNKCHVSNWKKVSCHWFIYEESEHSPTVIEFPSPFCAKIKHIFSNNFLQKFHKSVYPRSRFFHSVIEIVSISYHRYIIFDCGVTLVVGLNSTSSERGRWLSTQHTCRLSTFKTNKCSCVSRLWTIVNTYSPNVQTTSCILFTVMHKIH